MFILGLSKEGAFTQHSQALLSNPEVQEMLWGLVWGFFLGGGVLGFSKVNKSNGFRSH